MLYCNTKKALSGIFFSLARSRFTFCVKVPAREDRVLKGSSLRLGTFFKDGENVLLFQGAGFRPKDTFCLPKLATISP